MDKDLITYFGYWNKDYKGYDFVPTEDYIELTNEEAPGYNKDVLIKTLWEIDYYLRFGVECPVKERYELHHLNFNHKDNRFDNLAYIPKNLHMWIHGNELSDLTLHEVYDIKLSGEFNYCVICVNKDEDDMYYFKYQDRNFGLKCDVKEGTKMYVHCFPEEEWKPSKNKYGQDYMRILGIARIHGVFFLKPTKRGNPARN